MRERNSEEEVYPGNATEASPLSVKEAARRLGRSEWWTRTHFKKVEGALIMPGSGRRGTRRYQTITIPVEVFMRELKRFRRQK